MTEHAGRLDFAEWDDDRRRAREHTACVDDPGISECACISYTRICCTCVSSSACVRAPSVNTAIGARVMNRTCVGQTRVANSCVEATCVFIGVFDRLERRYKPTPRRREQQQSEETVAHVSSLASKLRA